VEPNLKRHHYNNISVGFSFTPYLPNDFSLLSTSILKFLEAEEPYLQRHHYANEVQERVMPGCGKAGPLLLPLYLQFN